MATVSLISVLSADRTKPPAIFPTYRVEGKIGEDELPKPGAKINPSVTSVPLEGFGVRVFLVKKHCPLGSLPLPDKLRKAPDTGQRDFVGDGKVHVDIGPVSSELTGDPAIDTGKLFPGFCLEKDPGSQSHLFREGKVHLKGLCHTGIGNTVNMESKHYKGFILGIGTSGVNRSGRTKVIGNPLGKS